MRQASFRELPRRMAEAALGEVGVVGGLFGASKDIVDDEAPAPQASDAPSAREVSQWPWEGQPDSAACDFAAGHLFHHLPARLTVNGGVHAETCLTAIGAIAGFAAQ